MARENKKMNPKNPKYEFKQAWGWPKEIEDFIATKIKGRSLNVCCGHSGLGDVKIDLFVKKEGIIKADMYDLPFKNGEFETIICDPPWELPYNKRHKLLWELCRVLKKGGRLIFNAFWWPKSKTLEVEEWWVGI
ncbi:unnamed protein product, partial [marine sediment metagenome]